MIESRKREGESTNVLFFNFSRKVKRSGVLKEARSRRFRHRNVSYLKRKISALHRAKKKGEMERARKLGLI